ncbi:hypothetical protein CRM22_002936 [Opisthorchis felineus]|uniref:Sema domain-containing protein n=1 Tax=Opisthorchis felineus TaxID=147828 RepID=A0A4S2M3N1_OPIFE|nr:hypothetical protein CRM22_002936 [Opisthorchis felineus]
MQVNNLRDVSNPFPSPVLPHVQSIFRTMRVTRIARVCQNDPGQGKAGEFLATNGVFSTFRKVRLQCRVDHSLGASTDDNESLGADHSPQLELTRALAVSELVPTDDGRDHVFYAVMTTSDPITRILGICAFSLQSVDEALNRPQVFTWQTSDSDNWLQRFWRTVLPLTGWSSASDDDFTYSTWSSYPTPGSSTLRIVGNTPMIEAITKSAERDRRVGAIVFKGATSLESNHLSHLHEETLAEPKRIGRIYNVHTMQISPHKNI